MITGSGNLQAGSARIGLGLPAQAYLASAKGLLPGVQILAPDVSGAAPSRALLAAQVLECLLKAYLAYSGVLEDQLKSLKRRHNLEVLWREAVAKGLRISRLPPDWCVKLNTLHDTPYHLRYPLHVHGLVLPASEPMTQELEELVVVVSRIVQGE